MYRVGICPRCKGYVTSGYDDDFCIHCGWHSWRETYRGPTGMVSAKRERSQHHKNWKLTGVRVPGEPRKTEWPMVVAEAASPEEWKHREGRLTRIEGQLVTVDRREA